MTLSHAWSWLKDSTAGRWNLVQMFMLFVVSSHVLWCCFKGWKSLSSNCFSTYLMNYCCSGHQLYMLSCMLDCDKLTFQEDDVTISAYSVTQWWSSQCTTGNYRIFTSQQDLFFSRKTQFQWKSIAFLIQDLWGCDGKVGRQAHQTALVQSEGQMRPFSR